MPPAYLRTMRRYLSRSKRPTIFDMGLIVFRENVLRHERVRHRLQGQLLRSIADERNGEVIDQDIIKRVLAMMVALGVRSHEVYAKDFEGPFLQSSQEFFRQESLQFLTQNNCIEYIAKAEQRIEEERQRVIRYLDSSTEGKLRSIAEAELIDRHARHLVEMDSGCTAMLRDGKKEYLRKM